MTTAKQISPKHTMVFVKNALKNHLTTPVIFYHAAKNTFFNHFNLTGDCELYLHALVAADKILDWDAKGYEYIDIKNGKKDIMGWVSEIDTQIREFRRASFEVQEQYTENWIEFLDTFSTLTEDQLYHYSEGQLLKLAAWTYLAVTNQRPHFWSAYTELPQIYANAIEYSYSYLSIMQRVFISDVTLYGHTRTGNKAHVFRRYVKVYAEYKTKDLVIHDVNVNGKIINNVVLRYSDIPLPTLDKKHLEEIFTVTTITETKDHLDQIDLYKALYKTTIENILKSRTDKELLNPVITTDELQEAYTFNQLKLKNGYNTRNLNQA